MDVSADLRDALDAAVGDMASGRTAIAFSGGLDSGVAAAMAAAHSEVTLYTAGTEGSYDVRASEELAGIMGLDWKHIVIREEDIVTHLREMISITGTVNPITLSFEIPLFCVLKHSSERVVLSGQGADEIFAGYAKYENLGMDELRCRMNTDMMELVSTTIEHERKTAERFGKTIRYPYLDKRVTDIVESIDIKDIAPKDLRKSFLRDVAVLIGRPEIAAKPKKAAQYGSGTMDAMRKAAKKRGMTVSSLISHIAGGRE